MNEIYEKFSTGNMKLSLVPETKLKDLLNSGSIVTLHTGENWHYLPFWFKELPNGCYQIVSFDKLPEEIKSRITEVRYGTNTESEPD